MYSYIHTTKYGNFPVTVIQKPQMTRVNLRVVNSTAPFVKVHCRMSKSGKIASQSKPDLLEHFSPNAMPAPSHFLKSLQDPILENDILRLIDDNAERIYEEIAKCEKINSITSAVPANITDGQKFYIFGKTLTVELLDRPVSKSEMLEAMENEGKLLFKEGSVYSQSISAFIEQKRGSFINDLFEKYIKISGYNGIKPSVSFKKFASKWGMCKKTIKSKKITKLEIVFSYLLVGLPLRYIEYVVAHEVTHLFEMNHSKSFYKRGEEIFPNFKNIDRQLNKEQFPKDLWTLINIDFDKFNDEEEQ